MPWPRRRLQAVHETITAAPWHALAVAEVERALETGLFISLVAVTIVHLTALYVPLMQQLPGTAPLSATQWSWILVVGLSVVVGGELDKLINRATSRPLG